MFKPADKSELNQVSLTGLRGIVLLGLLIEAPRSLKEIREIFTELNIFEPEHSDDILRIDINTLKENIGNKSELCDYLIKRFYNDGYHGTQETRVIWDISVIAYMINKNWFETKEISSPNIKEDTSYEITQNKHNVTFVTKLNRDKIYEDLFNKLGAK